MELKKDEHRERYGLKGAVGGDPQESHDKEYGGFHHQPAETVGDQNAPLPIGEDPIAGIDMAKRDEDDQRENRHDDEEKVECCSHDDRMWNGLGGAP